MQPSLRPHVERDRRAVPLRPEGGNRLPDNVGRRFEFVDSHFVDDPHSILSTAYVSPYQTFIFQCLPSLTKSSFTLTVTGFSLFNFCEGANVRRVSAWAALPVSWMERIL